ncbi:MAG TPA: cupredoxin domain-containing protein [Vicinamibacterales bacterium]|nr:cupredoxin domain-containing protein [Vicinamibacterales bacterium]
MLTLIVAQISPKSAYSEHLHPASALLYDRQVFVRLTFLADSVAAAGTALLLGAAAMSSVQQDPAAASAPREIPVVAKRFTFEPSRVEVTEGERIRLVVTSDDGVHGVEIKKFKVNKKVPRGGEAITIDFVASAAGEYPIACSEYCGNGHEEMKGTLVVVAKAPPR